MFYRATWVPGGGRDIRWLGTSDRREVERLGRQLLSALLVGETYQMSGPVRLGDLVSRYLSESAGYRDNKPRTRAEDRARLELIVASIGGARDVKTLTGDV